MLSIIFFGWKFIKMLVLKLKYPKHEHGTPISFFFFATVDRIRTTFGKTYEVFWPQYHSLKCKFPQNRTKNNTKPHHHKPLHPLHLKLLNPESHWPTDNFTSNLPRPGNGLLLKLSSVFHTYLGANSQFDLLHCQTDLPVLGQTWWCYW